MNIFCKVEDQPCSTKRRRSQNKKMLHTVHNIEAAIGQGGCTIFFSFVGCLPAEWRKQERVSRIFPTPWRILPAGGTQNHKCFLCTLCSTRNICLTSTLVKYTESAVVLKLGQQRNLHLTYKVGIANCTQNLRVIKSWASTKIVNNFNVANELNTSIIEIALNPILS